MRFKSVGAENHNKHHCTTHGTSNLKSSAMLIISSSCWINVLDVTHSCSTNAPAQTHFAQSIMDITVWKTLTWETPHHFLTMYFWVALQGSVKSARILWRTTEICSNPGSLLQPRENYRPELQGNLMQKQYCLGLMTWKDMEGHAKKCVWKMLRTCK